MTLTFRAICALGFCLSAHAATYAVLNRSGGLFNIPAGTTINGATAAGFDVAEDSGGNYIVAGIGVLQKVTPGGVISTIATAPAGSQWISVSIDATGNFIVADNQQHVVWRISSTGSSVVTVGSYPVCVTNNLDDVIVRVDGLGNYIVFSDNCSPAQGFRMTPGGSVTQIGLSGSVGEIGSMTFDVNSNYVLPSNGSIHVVTPAGTVSTLVTNSALNGTLEGIIRDPSTGNFVVTNRSSNTVMTVTPNGSTVTTIFTGAPLSSPTGIVVAASATTPPAPPPPTLTPAPSSILLLVTGVGALALWIRWDRRSRHRS